MELWHIILTVYFVVNFITAQKMQNVATLKGYGSEAHAFAMTVWLGIIGCIYVVSLPDKIQRAQSQDIIELLRKQQDNSTAD